MGWFNIYAAVYNEEYSSIFDFTQRYGKQLIWIIAAVVIVVSMMLIESRFYPFFAYPFYLIVLGLLIAVLLFGTEVNGARSWFAIGSFRFQPAEFAKFATALALARLLSSHNFKIHEFKNLLIIATIIVVPASFILLQNDTGSALVYASFIIVLFREGLSSAFVLLGIYAAILFILALTIPLIYIILFILIISTVVAFIYFHDRRDVIKGLFGFLIVTGLIYLVNILFLDLSIIFSLLIAVGAFSIVLIIRAIIFKYRFLFVIVGITFGALSFTYFTDYFFENVLEEHQRSRINHLLGIESDPLGAGYNVNQSKIAIGSGGLSGKGFLKGTQTKYDFVPEQSTDFIFCTVGEEWGFLGTTTVIIFFVVLLLRLIYLAERQRSSFSRIYGYAVVSILFFHIIVNIGMTIGLAPVIGIPLPFFSYGGSSLWAFTALLFVFLRLDASRLELLR
jgi:rod shape determining protein RodA